MSEFLQSCSKRKKVVDEWNTPMFHVVNVGGRRMNGASLLCNKGSCRVMDEWNSLGIMYEEREGDESRGYVRREGG